MINILLVVQSNPTGLTYHRQTVPHNHLKRNYEYNIREVSDIDSVSDEELKDYQIVSFLRLVNEKFRTEEIINRCKKLGCKVVVDIDDYWHLHPKHELHQAYKDNKVAEQTVAGLVNADWVTTTTEHFADKIKSFNSNVTVLSNSIDTTEKQFQKVDYYSERKRFGWIGGVYHWADVRLMYEGFNEVWKGVKYDKFQLCATFSLNDSYKFIESVYTNGFKYIDKNYLEYLLKYTPQGNEIAENQPYKRLWGKSVFEYATLYNEIDVALVPLVENNFNSYKSQIKIIEAGFFKKAVVVSNVMPYTIDCNKKNAVLVSPSKRNEGWGVAIKSMILNPNKIEDFAEAMHETVKDKYNMDNVNKTRNDLYKRLCE